MASVLERKLGEMLVRDNIISESQLEVALDQQSDRGGSLGRIIIESGYASEYDLAAALGRQLEVPFITLSHYEIDPDMLMVTNVDEAVPDDAMAEILAADGVEEAYIVALPSMEDEDPMEFSAIKDERRAPIVVSN